MGKIASIVVKITVGPFISQKRRTVEWESPLSKVAGKNAPQLTREFERLEKETARVIREGLAGDVQDDANVMDGDVVRGSDSKDVTIWQGYRGDGD